VGASARLIERITGRITGTATPGSASSNLSFHTDTMLFRTGAVHREGARDKA
jgi:hypothetical protein